MIDTGQHGTPAPPSTGAHLSAEPQLSLPSCFYTEKPRQGCERTPGELWLRPASLSALSCRGVRAVGGGRAQGL